MSENWIEGYFGQGTEVLATDCIVVKDANGRIFVSGSPEDEGRDEEVSHNCDAMGCGSFGPHIILIIKENEDE